MNIEQARNRLTTIINNRYKNNSFKEDMISIALAEHIAGASIYESILKARRAENKFNGAKYRYNRSKKTGQLTFVSLDLAGLIACQEDTLRQIENMERKVIATDILLRLIYLPTNKLKAIIGKSTWATQYWQRKIRGLLNLDPVQV